MSVCIHIRWTGWLLGAALVVAATGCSGFGAGTEGGDPESGAARHDHRGANATARWVEVTGPSDRALLEYPAEAVAEPSSSAMVALAHTGVVRTLSVRPGDEVTVGDPIAEVSVPELAVAAAVLDASRKELTATESRHEALQSLEGKRLVGRTAVFEMEAKALSLRTELARAKAALASDNVASRDQARLRRDGVVVVRSPIAGVVTDVPVMVGDRVGGAEGSIATVRGTDARRIEASTPRELPPASKARFVAMDGRTFDLTMAARHGVTSLKDGRQRVWFDLAANTVEGPSAGLRGRVLLSELPEDLREVPLASLTVVDGHASVVVEGDNGTHERRTVDVVTTTESIALVRGDLALGERVSSDPSQVLVVPEEEMPHGH